MKRIVTITEKGHITQSGWMNDELAEKWLNHLKEKNSNDVHVLVTKQ